MQRIRGLEGGRSGTCLVRLIIQTDFGFTDLDDVCDSSFHDVRLCVANLPIAIIPSVSGSQCLSMRSSQLVHTSVLELLVCVL